MGDRSGSTTPSQYVRYELPEVTAQQRVAEKLMFLGYRIVYVDVTGFHELCRFDEASHMRNLNSFGFLTLEEMVWFAEDFVSVLRNGSHEDEHYLGIRTTDGDILHVDQGGLTFAFIQYHKVIPYEAELDIWLTANRRLLEAQAKGAPNGTEKDSA